MLGAASVTLSRASGHCSIAGGNVLVEKETELDRGGSELNDSKKFGGSETMIVLFIKRDLVGNLSNEVLSWFRHVLKTL